MLAAAIQAFKACQEKLKCQTTWVLTLVMRGGKINISKLDLQVAEIKDLKSSLQPDVITMWHYLEHDYTPLENLI
jgi:hypothetical protein